MRIRLSAALAGLAAAALAVVAGCSSASTGSASTAGSTGGGLINVNLGSLNAGVNSAIIAVAEATNAFRDNGLNVTITSYESGSEGADITDLETGRTDFAYSSLSDAVTYDSQAVKQGKAAPIKIIAAGAAGAATLVLKKGLPFNSVNDLKGLTLAVAHLTSSYIPVLDTYLAAHGTSVSKLGIKLVAVVDANMVPSLEGGQIDGFIQDQPAPTIAQQEGVGKIVLAGSQWGEGSKVPIEGLFANASYINSHRAVAQKMVDALQQANAAFEAGPASKMIPIITSYTKDPTSVITGAYRYLTLTLAQPFSDAMSEYFKISVPKLVSEGTVSSSLTMPDVVDTSFAK